MADSTVACPATRALELVAQVRHQISRSISHTIDLVAAEEVVDRDEIALDLLRSLRSVQLCLEEADRG